MFYFRNEVSFESTFTYFMKRGDNAAICVASAV